MIRPLQGVRLLFGVFFFFSYQPAAAAPVTFNTALPVAQGNLVLREQLVRSQSGDDPSGADAELEVTALVTALGYGLTPRLALFGVLPFVEKNLAATSQGGRATRRSRGFGDAVLFGRYTVLQNDAPGRTFRLAPFLGVKTPSGSTDDSDGLGRLPRGLQPGTGSWDPLAGLVLTIQTLDFQVDAQAAFRATGEADGVEVGDVATADASFQYRLWPGDLGGVTEPRFLYGILEINLMEQRPTRLNGSENPDSGGRSLYLAPGVQLVTVRWIFETAVQWPVLQELNGTALERAYIFRAGFRVNL